jgi:transcriptional regulator with PAS, ATPase and Fis domain
MFWKSVDFTGKQVYSLAMERKDMKKYSCSVCSKTVSGALALTKHIRDCKSGKLARKGQKPACEDCGKVMHNWSALGAHRFRAHGILGKSRWSVKKRSMKTRAARGVAAVMMSGESPAGKDLIGQLLQNASKYRQDAQALVAKASKLEGMAKELQGVL